MPSGDVVVSVVAGGQLEKIDTLNSVENVRQIDLIKKIEYPESLIPDVDMPGTKGFRRDITSTDPLYIETISHQFVGKDVYLSSINVSCEKYEDLDYWELFIDTHPICENVYTLDAPIDSNSVSSFQTFPKVRASDTIIFKFYNGSGGPKKIWVTLGYMYKRI